MHTHTFRRLKQLDICRMFLLMYRLRLQQRSSPREFLIGNDQDYLRMEHAHMLKRKSWVRLLMVSKGSCWSLWHRRCLGDDEAWTKVWWWLAYWLWLRRCWWFWRFGANRRWERFSRLFCRRIFIWFCSLVLLPAPLPAVLQCSAAKLCMSLTIGQYRQICQMKGVTSEACMHS